MSIGIRLFLMILLAMAVVAGAGLGLVRWRLGEGMQAGPDPESPHVAALVRGIAGEFDAAHGWGFLPADDAVRAAWLRARVSAAQSATQAPATSTLFDRIAITDAQGRLLAGTQPMRALVALASIDRRRWTIPARHGVAGYVTVALPHDPDDGLAIALLMRKQRSLVLLAAFGGTLAALVAAMVAAGFRQPIRALVDGSRRLGLGEFEVRIDAHRRDELGELAHAFNALGARLAAAEQARRQWIADTSHELRTPLAVLRAHVDAVQDGIRPLTPESFAVVASQVESLHVLVDDLDQLARGDVGQMRLRPQPLDAWHTLAAVWHEFDGRLRGSGLHVQLLPPAGAASGSGDAQRLRQVMRNLLENSARYTAAGGRVVLAGEVDGSRLTVQLDDSEPAVPTAQIPRLGERFFRVDASRSREHGGSGLGLALSRQIVEAHGGRLTFAASPLGGLRATVVLPLRVA